MAPRSRRPIPGGFVVADALDRASHAHLPLDLSPVEDERGTRVRGEIPGLVALEVRVEDEASVVEPAEQYRARRNPAVGSGGCDGHRFGLTDIRSTGLCVPR